MERYFAFQRGCFPTGGSLADDSQVAVARGGDEVETLVWLARRTGKGEWLDFARTVASQTADWTTFYTLGGDGAREDGKVRVEARKGEPETGGDAGNARTCAKADVPQRRKPDRPPKLQK